MDLQRFDAIARRLGAGESRRRLFGLLGGSALGGTLAVGLADNSGAKKRKKKKQKCKGCTECETCNQGKCQPKLDGAACGGECLSCQQGQCTSKADDTTCSEGVCQEGECSCRSHADCPGDGSPCFCDTSFETGQGRCWAQAGDPCNIAVGNCNEDSDCGPGEGCMTTICGWPYVFGICWPLCAV